MKPEEVIEMAKQAGLFEVTKDGYEVFYPDNLEAFAKLVAAKERKACAKMCETFTGSYERGKEMEACAAAIRARGEA